MLYYDHTEPTPTKVKRLPILQQLFLRYTKFAKTNWFSGLLLLGVFYLILSKNISIQISMHNHPVSQTVALKSATPLVSAQSKTNSDKRTMFSVINPLGNWFSKEEKTSITDLPEKTAKITPNDASAANNFSNISAILATDLEKRYGLSKQVVEAKKATCANYVHRFSGVAVDEMQKFGIPASITLAQALLESDAGASRLAQKNNNHFGIKCFSKKCVKGHCSNFSDDSHKDFFRKYESNWESFRAHSKLLIGRRYKHLQLLGTKNYQKWAEGIQKAGYATDPKYAQKLISIIEKMELWRYDA